MQVPTYPDPGGYGVLNVEVDYRTDLARFDPGWVQRTARRSRSYRKFTIEYDLLLATEWQLILNLFERQKGGLSEFRFDDYVTPSPVGRQFAVGDGTTTVFHLPHDYTSGAAIKADGAPVATVYVDSETGRVQFATAPARGVELTYDGDEAAFRVRFAEDGFRYERLRWGGYAAQVVLEQISDLQDIYPIRQVVCGGAIDNRTLDALGEAVAYSFVCPCDVTADDASYYLSAITSPGTVRVSLCENDDGAPGTVLAYGDAVPAGVGWETVTFGASAALTQGTRYWLVIAAQSGTWDVTHTCDIQYTETVPDPIPGEDQDHILWGGYILQDRRPQNTPHSWLGVATKAAGGAWSLRDPTSHPAFYLNQVPQIVGHCQGPLTQTLFDLDWTCESFPIETVHDIIIDRVGGVFSTHAGAPADSLYYVISFDSDPGVAQRDGVISTPVDTSALPVYMEAVLWTPLTIPAGEGVNIEFYSTGSVSGVPWTHWGHNDSWNQFSVRWVANWNSVRWAEDESRAKISHDGGTTYPIELMGAWTVRCRGAMQP